MEDADAGAAWREGFPYPLYTQGIAAFTAAQRRGIESRLVVYPDENHWILKPKNSIQWYTEVLGWMDRHAKGE